MSPAKAEEKQKIAQINNFEIGSMENTLKEKLTQSLSPTHMEIVNESHLHAGHAGVAERGGSHFYILIVSDAFNGKNRIQRHQLVNHILETELHNEAGTGLHALRLKTLTPIEWEVQK